MEKTGIDQKDLKKKYSHKIFHDECFKGYAIIVLRQVILTRPVVNIRYFKYYLAQNAAKPVFASSSANSFVTHRWARHSLC